MLLKRKLIMLFYNAFGAAIFEGVLSLMVHGSRQLLVLGSGLKVQEYGQEV